MADLILLSVICRLRPPLASELAGYCEASAGPLDGEFPLHLGQTGHKVEEEASRRCAGIDGIGEALELHTLLLKLHDQVHKVLDAATEPVEVIRTWYLEFQS